MLAITLMVGSGVYADTFDNEVHTYFINGVGDGEKTTYDRAKKSTKLIKNSHSKFNNIELLYNRSKNFNYDLFEAMMLTVNLHDMYSRLEYSGGLGQKEIDDLKKLAVQEKSEEDQKILIKAGKLIIFAKSEIEKDRLLLALKNPDGHVPFLREIGFVLREVLKLKSIKNAAQDSLAVSKAFYVTRLKVFDNVLAVDQNIDEMFYQIHPKNEKFRKKKINLITHSEGGSFGNILAQRLSMLGDKVKILAIASPVEKVFVDSKLRQVGKGQLALKEDLIYQFFSNSNPANMTNYSSEDENILNSVILTSLKNVTKYGDESSHSFDIYMRVGSDSYDNIKILALANHKILSDYSFSKKQEVEDKIPKESEGSKGKLTAKKKEEKPYPSCSNSDTTKIMNSDIWERVIETKKNGDKNYVYVKFPSKRECRSFIPNSEVRFIDVRTGCFKRFKIYNPWYISKFTKYLCKQEKYLRR